MSQSEQGRQTGIMIVDNAEGKRLLAPGQRFRPVLQRGAPVNLSKLMGVSMA
jgi:hypothetical protein